MNAVEAQGRWRNETPEQLLKEAHVLTEQFKTTHDQSLVGDLVMKMRSPLQMFETIAEVREPLKIGPRDIVIEKPAVGQKMLLANEVYLYGKVLNLRPIRGTAIDFASGM
jgi:hypothetical protein